MTAAGEERPEKRHKISPSLVYIVRWAAHASDVEEWDYDELSQIETCSHEIEEAKGYITGEIDCGDAMLSADGLRKDDGVYSKVYTTIEQAQNGMKECHANRVEIMRGAIMKCCGINKESYENLLKGEDIVEDIGGKGSFPPSAKILSGNEMTLDTEICWGASEKYNNPGANNKNQHEFIRCCEIIMSGVTCWIETLEMVGQT
eukprot:CAMPEP_0172542556 /NCGR_PEP_ID=MMETSP1067-20121228/13143_1 /TAXON_ID=265564 ORGANISM="Thalassiosira punctigera, Strain Tpunct2005C2" /NCGR_SAMPLE_ID=MMETSP1067 /ASSEMBLY_ACC=CAM_ASM_000444 /LENGTH=202 /DNA_ID=CAMNT_0013328825 /DNA_START=55 /DNA_END=663 /DNA_ORIENTATION=+